MKINANSINFCCDSMVSAFSEGAVQIHLFIPYHAYAVVSNKFGKSIEINNCPFCGVKIEGIKYVEK